MKNYLKIITVAICMLLPFSSFAQDRDVKKILLLSAYHPNFVNGFEQIAGIRSVFPSDRYDLDVEFMDSKRFPNKEAQKLFEANLKYKLDNSPKYDLVIAAEDNALLFFLSHRKWFDNIPMVFLGVNDIEKGMEVVKDPLITGVFEAISDLETVSLAKRLNPELKKAYMVTDATETGIIIGDNIKKAPNVDGVDLELLSLNEYTWDEFKQKISALDKNSVIVNITAYKDKNNEIKAFEDATALLIRNADVPVYYLFSHGIGKGYIGGKVISHFGQGREAALLGAEYFKKGQIPSATKESPNEIFVDYDVAKKWNIDVNLIPKDAVIINPPKPSLFRKYIAWIISALALVLIQAGLILGLLINRKQRNKALKSAWKSEENLRITLESIGDGVIATDIDGNVTKINKIAEELTGWNREDCIGKHIYVIFNIVNLISGRKVANPVEKVIELRKVVDLEENTILISKTGNKLHITDSGAPIFNDDKEVVGAVLVFRDVTEKEALAKVARENEARMKMFFATTRDGIYSIEFERPVLITDNKAEVIENIKKEGRVLFANKQLAYLAGFMNEYEIIGHTLPEVALSKEATERQKLLLETLAKNNFSSCAIETTATSVEGIQRNINYKTTSIIEDNHIVRLWCTLEDVTELKKAEDQFHQAQKMDVIGRLAGGVAHDFNNMLAGILGHAELIEMKIDETSPIKRHVGPIINAATRAADLTNKLLAFSRKGKTISTTLDIHEIITSSLSLLERSFDKNITIETNFGAKQSKVSGDPTLLQNALMNLAINARDAMPTGGKLSFKTDNIVLSSDIEEASYNLPKGEYLEIHITDTGYGMSKATISKIFEPFFTTKPVGKGTGLGLSAVYGTIKEHKGSINVYSEVGVGTIFKIYLPIEAMDDANESLMANVDATLITGEGLILIVDDEALIRNMAKDILTSLGYKVLLAEDSDAAIDIFSKNKDEISLVLLDMVMPKKSGKELFKILRSIKSDVKVVVSSGFSRKDNIDEMIKDGAKGFIQKPYRQATLSQVIAKALGYS